MDRHANNLSLCLRLIQTASSEGQWLLLFRMSSPSTFLITVAGPIARDMIFDEEGGYVALFFLPRGMDWRTTFAFPDYCTVHFVRVCGDRRGGRQWRNVEDSSQHLPPTLTGLHTAIVSRQIEFKLCSTATNVFTLPYISSGNK